MSRPPLPILAAVALLALAGTVVGVDRGVARRRQRFTYFPTNGSDPSPAPAAKPVPVTHPGSVPAAPKKRDERPLTRNLSGTLLGRYRVVERLTAGGMAVIYRGEHVDLHRPVAIKVLGQPFLAADVADLARRFEREARTIATLRHPNIVQIFDYGVEGDVHYLVMEFVEGSNLQAAMKLHKIAGEPWRSQEILDLATQIAAALDYAHGQGIVHRDIKPANILLSTGGLPILTDFGLSAIRRTRTTLISTLGQPFGTPEYIAPEQAMDYSSANARSDVYSLGCVLYEMVTGHLPFESDTALSLALMHISSDPVPPSTYVPDLPPAVEQVLLKALEKEPADRFLAASALADALKVAWEEGQPLHPCRRSEDTSARSAAEAMETTTTEMPTADPRPDAESEKRASTRPELLPGGELTTDEARMVLAAIERHDGQISRAYVCQELGLTAYYARQMLAEWTAKGWLLKSTKSRQPATVSTRLAILARRRLGWPREESA